MGWFSDIIGKVKNYASEFVKNPLGKVREIGNAVASGLGKVKKITGIVKKAKDFVANIPVIGDAVQGSVGGFIDQADRRANQASDIADRVNGFVQ